MQGQYILLVQTGKRNIIQFKSSDSILGHWLHKRNYKSRIQGEAQKKLIFAMNEEENNFGAFDAVTLPTPLGFMETFIKRRVG